jgi:hypothetical protein
MLHRKYVLQYSHIIPLLNQVPDDSAGKGRFLLWWPLDSGRTFVDGKFAVLFPI